MGHETLLAAIAGVVAVALLRRSPARAAERAMIAALAALSIGVALPWLDVADAQGLPFRLRLVAFVPLALLVAAIGGAAVPARWRTIALAAIAVIVAIVQPRSRGDGVVVTHPAMVAGVQAMRGAVATGDVVITSERHIAFMVAWYTRADVRLRPEAVPPERRWRLMPLAFIGEGTPLAKALAAARAEPSLIPPRGLHPRHVDGLVLVPEATWTWVLARLPAAAQRHYAAWPTI
jgi:hypothetical protein